MLVKQQWLHLHTHTYIYTHAVQDIYDQRTVTSRQIDSRREDPNASPTAAYRRLSFLQQCACKKKASELKDGTLERDS